MRRPDNIVRHPIVLILAMVALTGLGGVGSEPLAFAEGTSSWSFTGNLNIPVSNHTATLLPDGRVLIAGGDSAKFGFHNTAELYDPATGAWNLTADLEAFISDHTATLLPNGNVLVAGGASVWNLPVESAELYDPVRGVWNPTGNLLAARYGHTATLLPNGRVLVAGGANDNEDPPSTLTSAELYDPATGIWSATGGLSVQRYHHTATLLPNGKVLVAGGYNGLSLSVNAAELYDPATGRWSGTGSLNTDRTGHTATLLPNGKVLVAGGYKVGDRGFDTLDSAELYDPVTETWSVTGSLNRSRSDHSAGLLSNGKVLVAGGQIFASWPVIILNEAELYDLATGTWSLTANLNSPRRDHTATLLPNGKVLVAGGYSPGELASAELYDSPSALVAAVLPSSRSVPVGTLATAFATIINTGSSTAIGCGIAPLTGIPATFSYQATDPATNQVTGTPNTPVEIPAGTAQSFVLALAAAAPISATDVELNFRCANTEPAPIIPGLNTFLFSASTSPIPDMIALAATPTGDGIVNILAPSGTGVFSVAAVNVGAGGNLTVSADTGDAGLPVDISICQTYLQSGACFSPPAASVTATVLSNETPTFGVFVTAPGNVSFDPAVNRIFVRFKDSESITRGSTSVAVRTQ
jgi:N-acetylneuraminic acid mutarotase